MSAQVRAALAVARRDMLLFVSYRTRFVSTLVTGLVGVTVFYYVSRLVSSPQVGSPDEYFGFVVVGTMTLEVLTSTLTSPLGTLRAEMLAGTFERVVISPFGPVATVFSLIIFPALLGLLTGFLTLVFAVVVFGLGLNWPDALLALPVALLGAFSFAPFGLLLAAAVLLFKQTNAGAGLVVTGVSLVAGLYFPVSLLPGWIRWTSDIQPFTPAAELLRRLLIDTPLTGSAAGDVAKLVGFSVVTLPIALMALRGAVRRSRRSGTITEY
jgi:ABC-2 type transport system permease protein